MFPTSDPLVRSTPWLPPTLPPSQSSSPFPAQTLRRWSAALKQNCQPLGFSSRLAVTCPYLSPPVPASPGPGPHACLSQLLKSVLASDPEPLSPWERLSSLSSLVLHELVLAFLISVPSAIPQEAFSCHLNFPLRSPGHSGWDHMESPCW